VETKPAHQLFYNSGQCTSKGSKAASITYNVNDSCKGKRASTRHTRAHIYEKQGNSIFGVEQPLKLNTNFKYKLSFSDNKNISTLTHSKWRLVFDAAIQSLPL
jgi:hypothetical protein